MKTKQEREFILEKRSDIGGLRIKFEISDVMLTKQFVSYDGKGIELTESLRKIKENEKIKIVFLKEIDSESDEK